MGPRSFPLLALAAALFSSSPAWAQDATVERLLRLEGQVGAAEKSLERVTSNVKDRSGFIGIEDAKRRFENAVFSYLIGDYDAAGKEFFTLVEANAFPAGSVYLSDSEWYLAECLFELGNYVLAEEAYQHIIDVGPGHPFFSDSVRRELEVYGITGDADAFYQLYSRYIVSGRVEPSDLVKYTVAKSFYRQGEYVRAKSLLSDIPAESMYHGRARYLLGVVLVVEGTYADAITEFSMASESSINTGEDRQVVDLANLALGRLAFETGDLIASSEYYQRISRESPYFADALYEIGWTFIKLGNYEQALQSVEIFLLAFPDHRYAGELRLLQGHLQMKQRHYDEALANYEGVIDEYTPVHDALAAIEKDEYKPLEWFNTLVELDSLDRYYGEEIPEFALDMLASDPTVARVVDLSKEIERQQAEIEESEVLIAELNAIFAGGETSIASFQQGRVELSRLGGDVVYLRGSLLDAEESWLLAGLPDAQAKEVRALRDERETLATGAGAGAVRTEAEAGLRELDRKREKLDKDIDKLDIQVDELAGELQALMGGLPELQGEERNAAERKRAELEGDLELARSELHRLEQERVRLRDQREAAEAVLENSGNVFLSKEYVRLHDQLKGYRGQVRGSDKAELARRFDTLWLQLEVLETGVGNLAGELDSLERSEFASLKKTFDTEVVNVTHERSQLTGERKQVEITADAATREGLARLREQFAQSVLEADNGVVDVYWVKKADVSEERKALLKEQESLISELDDRFRVIRGGLPAPQLPADAE